MIEMDTKSPSDTNSKNTMLSTAILDSELSVCRREEARDVGKTVAK